MSIKIGVPSNTIYDRIFSRFDEIKDTFGLELKRLPESKLIDLFHLNQFDIALLSPIGYASNPSNADLRIIPSACLSTASATGLAEFSFKSGLTDLRTCAVDGSGDFLIETAKILLEERYSIAPNFVDSAPPVSRMLEQADSAIAWGKADSAAMSMDISELWFDSYEMPLPIAFWVVRNEEYPEQIVDIIKGLHERDIPIEESIYSEIDNSGEAELLGKLFWYWSQDIENALEETFQLLFCRQMIPVIPAIKILGRETELLK